MINKDNKSGTKKETLINLYININGTCYYKKILILYYYLNNRIYLYLFFKQIKTSCNNKHIKLKKI